jgi:hypothetical protein
MGEVLRFLANPERERARLIRQARAIYDGIFPPAAVSEPQDEESPSQTVSGGNAHYSNGFVLS